MQHTYTATLVAHNTRFIWMRGVKINVCSFVMYWFICLNGHFAQAIHFHGPFLLIEGHFYRIYVKIGSMKSAYIVSITRSSVNMGLASTGFCHLYRMGVGRESILTGMRCSSILKSPMSILPRTVLTCLLPRGHTEPNHTSRFLLPCPQSNTSPRQTSHLTALLVLTAAFSSPAASGGSWWSEPRNCTVARIAAQSAHLHSTAQHCTALNQWVLLSVCKQKNNPAYKFVTRKFVGEHEISLELVAWSVSNTEDWTGLTVSSSRPFTPFADTTYS